MNVGCLVLVTSYTNHTLVILIYAPHVMNFLTAIFILFSTWLYNYYYK